MLARRPDKRWKAAVLNVYGKLLECHDFVAFGSGTHSGNVLHDFSLR